MRTRASWIVAGLLAVSMANVGRAEEGPSRALLGKKAPNIALTSTGEPQPLYEFKDKKAVVIVFLSFDCPISNSYAPALTEMAKRYGPQGVAFIGVSTNEDEEAARLAKQVKEFGIPFTVYQDKKVAVANALQADYTPEAFLLDGDFVVRYRGRIDSAYSARLKRSYAVSRHDLRQALDEMLGGKAITEPVTQAVGCPINRASASESTAKSAAKVTYYRDVLPILQEQCQVCHRPNEVAPFALMTYRQAVSWASDIKEYTQNRRMPPWKPSAGPGFIHERHLNDKEIATLASWVDGGTPAGDPKDSPPPRRFSDGWQLGTPDLILTVSDDFHLGASGGDLFRCFVLPTNLPEDKYVTAVEVRPGNPRIVHHTLNFIDTMGQGRKLEQQEKDRAKKDGEKDHGPGYTASMGVGFTPRGGMGGWAPGQVPHHLPEGTGYLLPKGADVAVQVHYHRNGRPEMDRTSIGLYFAKKPVERAFKSLVVGAPFLMIPAGADNHRVEGGITINQDCTIHSVMPHMHMIGKQIELTLVPPDGKPQTLIAIKDWDYNWQETYFFKAPIAVKAGTRIKMEAIYDNSANNPNNPNQPPKAVFAGRETTNEMCFGFLGATSDQPGRIRFSISRGEAK